MGLLLLLLFSVALGHYSSCTYWGSFGSNVTIPNAQKIAFGPNGLLYAMSAHSGLTMFNVSLGVAVNGHWGNAIILKNAASFDIDGMFL
jgi:hypothetical protein